RWLGRSPETRSDTWIACADRPARHASARAWRAGIRRPRERATVRRAPGSSGGCNKRVRDTRRSRPGRSRAFACWRPRLFPIFAYAEHSRRKYPLKNPEWVAFLGSEKHPQIISGPRTGAIVEGCRPPLSASSPRLHHRPARPVETGQQDCENASEENPIERAGAADRSNRRAETRHFVQIGEVGTDQRAQAAGNVSERRGVPPRQQQRHRGCY